MLHTTHCQMKKLYEFLFDVETAYHFNIKEEDAVKMASGITETVKTTGKSWLQSTAFHAAKSEICGLHSAPVTNNAEKRLRIK